MINERQRQYQFSSPLNVQAKRYGRGLAIQRAQTTAAKVIQIERSHFGSNPDLKWYSCGVIDCDQEDMHTNRVK